MRTHTIEVVPEDIDYPESDGLPLAENTDQLLWIVKLFSGFFGWYRNDPNVFVASDLLWYPVEGERDIRTAPDVMIAFGRPKGRRSSYRQWREAGVAPQVVIEIRSPSNTDAHLANLLEFYRMYGVEEYYLYDPDEDFLEGWHRSRSRLVRNRRMNGHVSPRLGIRFDTSGTELVVYHPDGRPFVAPDVQAEETEQEMEKAHRRVEHEKKRAEEEKKRAEEEKKRAEEEKKRAEEEKKRAEEEKKRANILAAKLRELGVDPDSL